MSAKKASPKRPKPTDDKNVETPQPPSFESTIHRLGQIVEELEAGELPLEESLRLFEEGVGLAKRSQGILENAERRVEQLLRVDEDGSPRTADLDIDS